MSKAKQIPASQQQQQAAATYSKYLQQDLNTRQKALSQYTEFKQEYHDLQTTLRDLPSEIEYDAMVPVGPLAFFPGKLVHTNEILVLLGDNWFVERSASQAADIAQRREEFVTEKIEQLRKELSEVVKRKDILPSALSAVGELEQAMYNEEGERIVDIKEEVTEEHLAAGGASDDEAELERHGAALKAVRERAISTDAGGSKSSQGNSQGSRLGKEEQDLLALIDQFDSEEDEEDEDEVEEENDGGRGSDEEEEEGDAFSDEDRANAARDDDDDDFNDMPVRESMAHHGNDDSDDGGHAGFRMNVVEKFGGSSSGSSQSPVPHKSILKESSPVSYFKAQKAQRGSRKSVSFDRDVSVHVPHSQELLDGDENDEVDQVANLLSTINMSSGRQAAKPPRIVVLDEKEGRNESAASIPKKSLKFEPNTAMAGVRSKSSAPKQAPASTPPVKKAVKETAVHRPMKQAIVERGAVSQVTQDTVDEELHSREIAQAYNRMRFAKMSAGKLDDAAKVAERVLEDMSGVKLVDSKAPKEADDGYERIELPADPSPLHSNAQNGRPPEVIHQERRPPVAASAETQQQDASNAQPKMSRFKARRLGLEK